MSELNALPFHEMAAALIRQLRDTGSVIQDSSIDAQHFEALQERAMRLHNQTASALTEAIAFHRYITTSRNLRETEGALVDARSEQEKAREEWLAAVRGEKTIAELPAVEENEPRRAA